MLWVRGNAFPSKMSSAKCSVGGTPITVETPNKIWDLENVTALSSKAGVLLQGLMFGYATDETEECMPLTIVLAHKLNTRMADLRRSGVLPWLRPDSKTQVSCIHRLLCRSFMFNKSFWFWPYLFYFKLIDFTTHTHNTHILCVWFDALLSSLISPTSIKPLLFSNKFSLPLLCLYWCV